jgi:REP element-mobilizing transposase RayT
MPQSLSVVHIHLVFSTKGREPFLRNTEVRKEMYAYLGGISKELDSPPVIVGGTEDHVHLLCRLARTISQADWVKEIKRVSSIWIKQREPALAGFAWQGDMAHFPSAHQPWTQHAHTYPTRRSIIKYGNFGRNISRFSVKTVCNGMNGSFGTDTTPLGLMGCGLGYCFPGFPG